MLLDTGCYMAALNFQSNFDFDLLTCLALKQSNKTQKITNFVASLFDYILYVQIYSVKVIIVALVIFFPFFFTNSDICIKLFFL